MQLWYHQRRSYLARGAAREQVAFFSPTQLSSGVHWFTSAARRSRRSSPGGVRLAHPRAALALSPPRAGTPPAPARPRRTGRADRASRARGSGPAIAAARIAAVAG